MGVYSLFLVKETVGSFYCVPANHAFPYSSKPQGRICFCSSLYTYPFSFKKAFNSSGLRLKQWQSSSKESYSLSRRSMFILETKIAGSFGRWSMMKLLFFMLFVCLLDNNHQQHHSHNGKNCIAYDVAVFGRKIGNILRAFHSWHF